MKTWERLPHTADIKIRVYGSTQQELFERALQAMFAVLGPLPLPGEKGRVERTLHVKAHDAESLMVDFLSEALYFSEVHSESYDTCTIEFFRPWEIRARVKGLPVEGFESGEIKAVTYHDLKIAEHNGVWQTDIVFDV